MRTLSHFAIEQAMLEGLGRYSDRSADTRIREILGTTEKITPQERKILDRILKGEKAGLLEEVQELYGKKDRESHPRIWQLSGFRRANDVLAWLLEKTPDQPQQLVLPMAALKAAAYGKNVDGARIVLETFQREAQKYGEQSLWDHTTVSSMSAACQSGDVRILAMIWESGTRTKEIGERPLKEALRWGNTECADYLVEQGVDPLQIDPFPMLTHGEKPLKTAAWLLKNQIDVSANNWEGVSWAVVNHMEWGEDEVFVEIEKLGKKSPDDPLNEREKEAFEFLESLPLKALGPSGLAGEWEAVKTKIKQNRLRKSLRGKSFPEGMTI
jgi:hypothetical protein